MDKVDVCCVVDDRHRVGPLASFLDSLGLQVTVCTEQRSNYSDPVMVVCTRHSLRETWVQQLLDSGARVIALRLDDTPMVGNAMRTMDLRRWPARSVDRDIGRLVRWLKHPEGKPGFGASGAASPDGTVKAQGRRIGGLDSASWKGLGILALLVVGVAALMTLSTPDPVSEPDLELDSEPDVDLDVDLNLDLNVDLNLDVAPDRYPATGERQVTGDRQVISDQQVTGDRQVIGDQQVTADTAHERPESIARPDSIARPETSTEDSVEPVASQANDTLAHLCRANSPEAARAWAMTLDWRGRRRARTEPCVEALLNRSGFSVVEPFIDR